MEIIFNTSAPPDTTASQLAKMLTAGSAPVVAADALENVPSQQMPEWESPESPRYDTIAVFKSRWNIIVLFLYA